MTNGTQRTFCLHGSHCGGTWITASTEGELADKNGWRVFNVDKWIEENPCDVVASWLGTEDPNIRTWLLIRGKESLKVDVPGAHMPWHSQQAGTELKTLPEWAIKSLVDLGEIEISEKS